MFTMPPKQFVTAMKLIPLISFPINSETVLKINLNELFHRSYGLAYETSRFEKHTGWMLKTPHTQPRSFLQMQTLGSGSQGRSSWKVAPSKRGAAYWESQAAGAEHILLMFNVRIQLLDPHLSIKWHFLVLTKTDCCLSFKYTGVNC